jgi:hypothetical protein
VVGICGFESLLFEDFSFPYPERFFRNEETNGFWAFPYGYFDPVAIRFEHAFRIGEYRERLSAFGRMDDSNGFVFFEYGRRGAFRFEG